MKRIIIFLVAILLVSCSSSSVGQTTLKIVEPSDDLSILREEVNEDLIKSLWAFSDKVHVLSTDENMVYSPVSLYAALSMLIPASHDSTKEELLSFLELKDPSQLTLFFKRLNLMTDKFSNFISNSVWINGTSKDIIDMDIINELEETYLASSHLVDFNKTEETGKIISDFISEQTKGFLKPEYKPQEETDVMLLNTLYFKDSWVAEFGEADPINFKGVGEVPGFITLLESPIYHEDDEVQMVTKHFENGHSILFVKPKQGLSSISSYSELIEKLRQRNTDEKIEVELTMPEIEVSSNHDELLDHLRDNGLAELLSSNPNLSFYNNGQMSYVNKIIQEAKIVVDKEGAEAAAYTIIETSPTSIEPEAKRKIEMILDEPYLMILMGNYEEPLFIVNIINPTK